MKISAAFRDAFRVYFGHFGDTLKFLVVELCLRVAVCAPLLFLTDGKLKPLALLSVPMFILLVFWGRVNAAAGMMNALRGGRLSTYLLVDPSRYGAKLAYGLKQALKMTLLWISPLIACLLTAYIYYAGQTDAFTLLRKVMQIGQGDLTRGFLYLAGILCNTLVLVCVGCAFFSGNRHAFVHDGKRLVRGHRGKIMLVWLCALCCVVPLVVSVVLLVLRYAPALLNVKDIMSHNLKLPDTKTSLAILGAGAGMTILLQPLRSLITAAFMNGLDKEGGRA